MFSSHLASTSKATNDQHQDAPSTSYADATSFATGICYSVYLSFIFSFSHFWVVDLGATRHICSNAHLFESMRTLVNASVTLPNHTRLPVNLCGDINMSSSFILKDVYFVPQFKINLISVSALTSDSELTVSFVPNCFMVQEINSNKIIGKGKKMEDLYILDTNTTRKRAFSESQKP
ncbi:hypothetical protein Ddye_009540 [Dipteronia dyeriana]|uniref:Retrovirus-related Pol polyprotein from transposon TNT 1-94-like beta-barrel domain-containing protein n=1 Tax=Dipteronia dyeriana TaxID=168575 RepID=A0AAE0CMZ5_9ROSI|nr:hypothetical protein Ddye_009540 [Dipteronia dyeriana]